METKVLDGVLFKKLVQSGAANLSLNSEIVNDLNVFPIPDGDTGDNMALTINGGVSAIDPDEKETISDAAAAVSKGMLLSARGNSGVILSQFFAGVSEGLRGKEEADVAEIGEAMKQGVKSAYASVIKPVEGTMLTVVRESVDYACSRVTPDSTLESFVNDYNREMYNSLQRTPELLDVLKEAGVIDSGGAGMYFIADGIFKALKGESIEGAELPRPAVHEMDFSMFDENSKMDYGYCTELLLRLTREKTDIESFDIHEIIDFLDSIGDSIVAVRDGTIVKIHVHTLTPEKVIEFAHNFGEFLTMKIENMTLQHHDTITENRMWRKKEAEGRRKYGLVTVADGQGVIDTLKGLGADIVIEGGQGKNPSTEDFIDAFGEVNAETIFVLPNNKNIIMAAKQAGQLFEESEVVVVESKSIGDGYAALTMLSYDSGDTGVIANELRDAMDGVVTGHVTRAVRSATVEGVEIKESDYIGFTEKNMLVSLPNAIDTAIELSEKIGVSDHEFIIVIYGCETREEDKNAYREYMRTRHPGTELYEIEGGQDIYHFILIVQ